MNDNKQRGSFLTQCGLCDIKCLYTVCKNPESKFGSLPLGKS